MERPFVTQSTLKYNDIYILPWHLHNIPDPDCLYKCVGGEVVKMEYLNEYNIDNQEDLVQLESLCRELFNIDFSLMRAIWEKRRPDLPLKIWYKVKMHLQWK